MARDMPWKRQSEHSAIFSHLWGTDMSYRFKKTIDWRQRTKVCTENSQSQVWSAWSLSQSLFWRHGSLDSLSTGRWSHPEEGYCWGEFLSLVMKILSFVFPRIQGDCKVTAERMASSKDRYRMETGMPGFSCFKLTLVPSKESVLFCESSLSASYKADSVNVQPNALPRLQ
jgi:hypothetical protein